MTISYLPGYSINGRELHTNVESEGDQIVMLRGGQ
jgi:hypothetical protein